jgi:hypothetical protein
MAIIRIIDGRTYECHCNTDAMVISPCPVHYEMRDQVYCYQVFINYKWVTLYGVAAEPDGIRSSHYYTLVRNIKVTGYSTRIFGINSGPKNERQFREALRYFYSR